MIVLMMGVSGAGKSTTGKALAESLGWPFFDADDFHPESNVAKMAAGQPLTDVDRWLWIERIADAMRGVLDRGGSAVFACSALKSTHRQQMQRAGDVRVVFLNGDAETIGRRLAARTQHFMPVSLLPSQFAALEAPTDALVVDIRDSVPTQVTRIREGLAIPTPEHS